MGVSAPRDRPAGCTLCPPRFFAGCRVRCRRNLGARARHRGERRDLLADPRDSAPAAAIPRSRPAGVCPDRASQSARGELRRHRPRLSRMEKPEQLVQLTRRDLVVHTYSSAPKTTARQPSASPASVARRSSCRSLASRRFAAGCLRRRRTGMSPPRAGRRRHQRTAVAEALRERPGHPRQVHPHGRPQYHGHRRRQHRLPAVRR